MFDLDGLDALVGDLTDAPRKAQRNVVKAVRAGGQNIERDARKFSSGLSHAPLYPASITYDSKWDGNTIEVEVGPDKDRPQGALGNLLEYGSVNNAPVAHLGPAFDRNIPDVVQAVAEGTGL